MGFAAANTSVTAFYDVRALLKDALLEAHQLIAPVNHSWHGALSKQQSAGVIAQIPPSSAGDQQRPQSVPEGTHLLASLIQVIRNVDTIALTAPQLALPSYTTAFDMHVCLCYRIHVNMLDPQEALALSTCTEEFGMYSVYP